LAVEEIKSLLAARIKPKRWRDFLWRWKTAAERFDGTGI
jgi:hypothetical protein